MRTSIVFLAVLLALPCEGIAQSAGVAKKDYNIARSGLALDGYDPVSYFKAGEAVEGKKEIVASRNGVTYRFVSNQNKEAFLAQPEKFEPQYGGWCAYAMGAEGEKVEVDPETFKIIDGKLYLFYNKFFNNTLESWNKDETRLKANADKNWSKIIQQKDPGRDHN